MAFLTWEQAIQKHGDKVPHWQQGQGTQFVTFRLGDALPLSKLRQWREARRVWLEAHPLPWDEATKKQYERVFMGRIEDWLDEGMGSCLWRDGGRRRILEETLMRFQGGRVVHHAWVIMPNHVHLLFTPGERWAVPDLIQAWKGHSARRIGQGSVWQRNYRDTLIRDAGHFGNVLRYIKNNPVRAQLSDGEYSLRVDGASEGQHSVDVGG